MEHRRFLVDKQAISGNQIIIENKEDIHRLRRVLRLKKGARIIVLDGLGKEYQVVLTSILPDRACGEVLNQVNHLPPQSEIILYQAILKSTRMDLVIQKATELGVSKIVPVRTERSVVKLADIGKRQFRWEKIAEAAFLQSAGVRKPVIEPVKGLEEALEEEFDLGILFWEGEQKKNLKKVLNRQTGKKVAILIGPEGGFTLNEVELARRKGMISVTLGQQILRSETASIVAVALVRYELSVIQTVDYRQ